MGIIESFIEEPAAKKAWLILSAIIVVPGFFQVFENRSNFTDAEEILTLILAVPFSALILYCLINIRGVSNFSSGEKPAIKPIGIWGYLWRSLVVYYASIIFFAVSAKALGLSAPLPQSLTWIVSMYVVMSCFAPIACWLAFSSNRKSQFNYIFSLFRGF